MSLSRYLLSIHKIAYGGVAFDIEKYQEGIYRKPTEKKNVFEYFYVKNNQKVEDEIFERIKKLRIPPIWEKVWVSSDELSKIQAVGIDSKGLKQYVYHQNHIKNASENKFIRVYKFIKILPKLEKSMDKDRNLDYLDKDRVIVTILDVVKKLHIRVGKEIYVKRNKSYGISSLRKHHIKINNGVLTMKFKAKSNKKVSYTIKDKKIISHIEELMKLEGDKIFQYKINNEIIGITSDDINAYIRKYIGKEFTVKDFRSYASNYYFVKTLMNNTKKNAPKNAKIIKKNIKDAIEQTAFHLRHTPSISKKSYVLNFAIETYQNNPAYFIDAATDNKSVDSVILDLLTKYADKCGKPIEC